MNRALDETIHLEHPHYFSVQADKNLWPIACCEVSKESNSQLRWIFARTNFPSIIQAQENGKKLYVPGMGEYDVEWHLSANMKTIKCMYGFQGGANAKYSCIYCLQERTKRYILGSEAQAFKINKKRESGFGWKGGLFAEEI